MNKLLLVLVLVLVLGGGYYLMSRQNAVPVENAMPVLGTSGVEEMVVQQSPGPEDAMMEEGKREFTLDASEFAFSVKTMIVKKGDTVTITLTNSGKMMHDWMVDEFNARTKQITNGETDTMTFVADQAGTFEYYCSVGAHRANGMVGELIVE